MHQLLALLSALVAWVALVGWVTGIESLTTFVPGRPQLAPLTSAALCVGSLAAAALPRHRGRAVGLGAILLLLGATAALRHFVRHDLLHSIPAAWWSSKFTSMVLIATAMATLLLALRRHVAGQVVSFGVLLVCGLMGLAHLFPEAMLYRVLPGTGVAVPTVVGLAALSLSLLLSCRSKGIAGALASHTLAGRTGRRLLLAGITIVVCLSLLLAAGLRLAWLDAESAVLLVGWSAISVIGVTLWGLAVAVDRAHSARIQAEKERDEQRTMVMAALSHDVRSPLQAAVMSAVLLQRLTQGEQAAHAIKRLQRAHRRIDRLLRSLLDSLALEGGQQLQLHAEWVQMHELVAEAVSENASLLESRVAWTGQAQGWWDRDAIYRVIENLLLNAAKYGRPDTPIWCRMEAGDAMVTLHVENQGDAIPEDQWALIFKPFQRAMHPARTAAVGWGVGLAFAKEVATRHAGTIRVARSGEEGTAFELALPVDARAVLGTRLGQA